ncbi:MAG: type II secretion system protein [Nitrospinales bacterium]
MQIRRNKIPNKEEGFTFIELILVIVLIGILSSVAVQKMLSVAENAEIAAEDRTIEIMRQNILNNFGDDLIKGKAAFFPGNPFQNLRKVPEGYDRRRITPPTGLAQDDRLWVFVLGTRGESNLTPERVGTTLPTFQASGFIYHQRRDHSIIKWPYDSTTGIIGSKIIAQRSDAKVERDTQKAQRGQLTEQDILFQRKRAQTEKNRAREIRQRIKRRQREERLQPRLPGQKNIPQ